MIRERDAQIAHLDKVASELQELCDRQAQMLGERDELLDAFRESERELMRQRDELLEALRYIEGVAMADEARDLPGIAQTARAAIAKVEGGAA